MSEPERMNLTSGSPFWMVKNGIRPPRPTLDGAERCDVAVIGAGVTGALVADALTTAGLDVVVVDRRESGGGSTAASTALLQYEIDLELTALSKVVGAAHAERAYRASLDAVHALGRLATELGGCDFARRPSLYLASTRRDAQRLEREAAARASIGIEASWWTRADVDATYGFPGFGAVRSVDAAEVDALALTRALLDRAAARGARWFEQTDVCAADSQGGRIHLRTRDGATIDARHAICAVGYDLPAFVRQDRVALHSTYALATHRLPDLGTWDDRCLVWESARPYTYMRSTADNRVIIGGEDVGFRDAAWRDRLLPGRTRKLEQQLRRLLPSLRTETAFEWAGTFAETPDGLPYIGADERYPGILFALGYGGNGITFSAIAAAILTATCTGETHPDADLFRMDR
ncbi:MAG: FAD-binding oxidoreductase [Gemmatimonadaceae bacterium]|nr:FAD-binding oxidoreductase [Gemmatimonadaceae bacterium]